MSNLFRALVYITTGAEDMMDDEARNAWEAAVAGQPKKEQEEKDND